jgi:hypothetical protein
MIPEPQQLPADSPGSDLQNPLASYLQQELPIGGEDAKPLARARRVYRRWLLRSTFFCSWGVPRNKR